ncbi:MAG: hypothetical protein RL235_196 [Chlamydiota bacterium]
MPCLTRLSFIFCGALSALAGEELCSSTDLFRDLRLVEEIDAKINDSLPVFVNYQLQGGYFAMPSARTYKAGLIGLGFASVPPYQIYSLGFQFFDHIEATGNYWVFTGKEESNFGHFGFGDDAERAANLKFVLLRSNDGFPFLPDIALGINDCLGTQRFNSFYVVATKELLACNLEGTFGWGRGRIKGFYGGVAWTPFRHSRYFWKSLTLAAEYDANDYKRHVYEHAPGRTVKSRINAGAQLKLWDLFRISASSIRGDDWAASIAFQYNLGATSGLYPKIYDPPTYTAPVDKESLGPLRSERELAEEFAYAFQEQGFDLSLLYLVPAKHGKDELWMKVINVRYREEDEVRRRIEYVLGALTPENLSGVTVVIEADGVLEHEYHFRLEDIQRYCSGRMGEAEFQIVAPLREASSPPSIYEGNLLYRRKKPVWMLTFRPWLGTFFGSSRGKFKYETGVLVGPEGYLLDQFYYNVTLSYTILSSMQKIGDKDTLNPSKLINVRTDTLRYNQSASFHVEQAYLQKSMNWGSGWFSRLAAGYFEVAYGGVAAETLYYPVNFNWAIGFEAAAVWKRRYFGLGFTNKIRKFTSDGAIYVPYVGFQYFVDFYYQYKPLGLDFKVSAGQFLAWDKGLRLEGSRTYASGLRVGLWYTWTNGNDVVNGKRYYDKGFFISMPLDMFLNKSSRTRIQYGMAAWLRDVGAKAATGKDLYNTLYWERFNSKPVFY